MQSYNRAAVKRLNERLRKIRVKYGENSSAYYKSLKDRLTSEPNSKRSQAYVFESDINTGEMKIRLLNKTEFEQATPEVKELFYQELERGLTAKTSTLKGINEAHKKAGQTLKDNPEFKENLKDVDAMTIGDAWKMQNQIVDYLKSINEFYDETTGYDLMVNYLLTADVSDDAQANFNNLAKRLIRKNDQLEGFFEEYGIPTTRRNTNAKGKTNGRRKR